MPPRGQKQRGCAREREQRMEGCRGSLRGESTCAWRGERGRSKNDAGTSSWHIIMGARQKQDGSAAEAGRSKNDARSAATARMMARGARQKQE